MTTEQNKSPPEHTPGPWVNGDNGLIFGQIGDNQEAHEAPFICDVIPAGAADRAGIGETTPEEKANANLIAAAPELLEALEGIASYMIDSLGMEHDRDVIKAMAAIAKARGQQ
jgi:hypothetical protein